MEQTDRGPGGAGSSGGHGGTGSSGGHGGTASETAAPAPTSVSSAGALLPPPKISLGKLGVSGALRGEHTKTVKKTVVTDWSITATAGWLVNTAAAGWGYHDRLA